MSSSEGKSEHIIQNVVGCGLFQVALGLAVYGLTQNSFASTMMLMSFGNYNPGWRCLDVNDTTTDNNNNNNNSSYDHSGGEVFVKDNCSLFTSCKNVQFSSEASTIVSEWGLLCEKAWIPSIILSIQMGGFFLGATFAGNLGDIFGRKMVMYSAQLELLIFNIVSIFSSSWQMFAALRFFLGVGMGSLVPVYYVYMAENVTKKWRAPILNAPHWSINACIFALVCMLTKNWRHLQIYAALISLVALIPALWLPESLRWLESKNKTNEFDKAVKKVAKANNKLNLMTKELTSLAANSDAKTAVKNNSSILDIFRGKYRKYTLLITLPWLSMGLIYYALAFGVKALSGDFYINLILSNVLEISLFFISMYTPNVLGRRKAGLVFGGLCSLSLIGAALFRQYARGLAQVIGVVVLANVGKFTIDGAWGVLAIYAVELYPTVVRGIATGWGNVMACIGSTAAPFLIPNEEDTFVLCFILMGVLATVVCLLMGFLPETKGKALKNIVHGKEESAQELSRVEFET